jgi:hypothetical protein
MNDACNFGNVIVNNTHRTINNLEIDEFFLNSIKIINGFNEKSKHIIIKLLEVIILDNFVKDDNLTRTSLYLKKISIDILIRWKKSNNIEYNSDIDEFNNMVQSNNIRFNPYDNLSNIIHPLNNLDFDIKLKLKEKKTDIINNKKTGMEYQYW